MAVGGVDHHHVYARLDQRHRTLIADIADGGGRADQEAAVAILGGQRIGFGLVHVLDGDQADGAIGLVHHDQPLDLAFAQERPRLFRRRAFADGGQARGGHQGAGRQVEVGLETHVPVGQDADKLAGAGLDHGKARYLALSGDGQDVAQRRLRVHGQRVDDHAAFVALDLADLVGLLLDRHIAVKDAHAAGLGHGDGEPAFGHRVHGGGHQRDVQTDLPGEFRRGVHLARHDFGRAWFEQNVVEGEPFANLHETLHFAGRV